MDDTIVLVPVDDLTKQWLDKLHALTGTPIAQIIISMLKDIRRDDEAAHGELRLH
jgi:hypothetical protein